MFKASWHALVDAFRSTKLFSWSAAIPDVQTIVHLSIVMDAAITEVRTLGSSCEGWIFKASWHA